MPEAEDVLTDLARHAVIQAQAFWRRRQPAPPAPLSLPEVAPRLDLLLTAVFDRRFPLRVAAPPPPPTLLSRLQRRGPQARAALPATDDHHLWLPRDTGLDDPAVALRRFRLLALLQAARAVRGSAAARPASASPLQQSLYLLLEAQAAEGDVQTRLPGLAADLVALRRDALASHPPLAQFPDWRRPLEQLARDVLAGSDALPPTATPADSIDAAAAFAARLTQATPTLATARLFPDGWSGELRAADAGVASRDSAFAMDDAASSSPARSARLRQPPRRRRADPHEDDARPGAWMVQTSSPQEKAEDPQGLQRPSDRDCDTAAEELADALAELPEARLVATPGRPKEFLLADDAPTAASRPDAAPPQNENRHRNQEWNYPEWDYRRGDYRRPGATVRLLPPALGPADWEARTLERHRGLVAGIRRQFEQLRARRQRLYRRLDGDDIDLAACVESEADFRAGLPRAQALYQQQRPARRELALLLLIDVSGSTDSWVAQQLRVIDVEREALLLVSIALQGLCEPYAIQAFSGEGPGGVTVRELKSFAEPHGEPVARRIAALEPEHYTRAGAALRHATATLLRQDAQHRLLLLLSDGKPNDVDEYEGRYGVEDMRQAVAEARCHGISCFCLTIDRQAADYLPAVFGARQYALLQEPSRLPRVLLDWLRQLVAE